MLWAVPAGIRDTAGLDGEEGEINGVRDDLLGLRPSREASSGNAALAEI